MTDTGQSLPTVQDTQCPECGSDKIYKDGLRYLARGPKIQRYICRDCAYRFSERNPNVHNGTNNKNSKSALPAKAGTENLLKAIALTETDIRQKRAPREGTTNNAANTKGKIVEFAWWLQKQGYKSAKNRIHMVKRLVSLGADLNNPDSVKDVLAKQQGWKDGYKMLLMYAYESFLHMTGKTWNKPRYKQEEAMPFIPTEEELNQLIAGCGKTVGTFLQGLKDTGADPG